MSSDISRAIHTYLSHVIGLDLGCAEARCIERQSHTMHVPSEILQATFASLEKKDLKVNRRSICILFLLLFRITNPITRIHDVYPIQDNAFTSSDC